jgi:hypothetical protein
MLNTVHRMLYDLVKAVNTDSEEDFEIGCRCKDAVAQLKLYTVFNTLIGEIENVKVEMKDESFIVCVKRVGGVGNPTPPL